MNLEDFGFKIEKDKNKIIKGEEKFFLEFIKKIDSKFKLPFENFLNDFQKNSIITFFDENEDNLLFEIIDSEDFFSTMSQNELAFNKKIIEEEKEIFCRHRLIKLYFKEKENFSYFIYVEEKNDTLNFSRKEKKLSSRSSLKTKEEIKSIKLIYKLNDLFSLEQFYNNKKELDIVPFFKGNSIEFWKLLLEIHKNDKNIFSDLYKEIELLPKEKRNYFLYVFFKKNIVVFKKDFENLNDVLKEKFINIKWNENYNKISFFINFFLLNFVNEIPNKEKFLIELSKNNQLILDKISEKNICYNLFSVSQCKRVFLELFLIEKVLKKEKEQNEEENFKMMAYIHEIFNMAENLKINLDITKISDSKSVKKIFYEFEEKLEKN